MYLYWLGFDNSLFSLYSETSGNDGALFTAIHSVFSSVGGIGILSVGPVGMSLIKLSPMIEYSSYGIGKYKVRDVTHCAILSADSAF